MIKNMRTILKKTKIYNKSKILNKNKEKVKMEEELYKKIENRMRGKKAVAIKSKKKGNN
jgi:hypothetical protein